MSSPGRFNTRPSLGMKQVWQVVFYPQDVMTYPNAYVLYTAPTERAGYDFIDTVEGRDDVTIWNPRTHQDVNVNDLNGSWEVHQTFLSSPK